jgi:hypothetical protein
MEWHARLMSFLLMCCVLIGLNVVATISGVYTFGQQDDDESATLVYTETLTGVAGYSQSENR